MLTTREKGMLEQVARSTRTYEYPTVFVDNAHAITALVTLCLRAEGGAPVNGMSEDEKDMLPLFRAGSPLMVKSYERAGIEGFGKLFPPATAREKRMLEQVARSTRTDECPTVFVNTPGAISALVNLCLRAEGGAPTTGMSEGELAMLPLFRAGSPLVVKTYEWGGLEGFGKLFPPPTTQCRSCFGTGRCAVCDGAYWNDAGYCGCCLQGQCTICDGAGEVAIA